MLEAPPEFWLRDFSPSGRFVIGTYHDTTVSDLEVRIWQTVDGDEVGRFPGLRAVFAAGERHFAIIGREQIALYETADLAQPYATITLAPDFHVEGLAYTADGEYLAVTTATRASDAPSFFSLPDTALAETVTAYDVFINTIVPSSDGRWLAAETDNGVKVWQVAAGEPARYHSPADRVAIAPDSQTIALGYGDGRIEWRRLADGALLTTIDQ